MNKLSAFLKDAVFLSKTGVENVQMCEMDEFTPLFWKKQADALAWFILILHQKSKTFS